RPPETFECLLPILAIPLVDVDHVEDDRDTDVLPHLGDGGGHHAVVGNHPRRRLEVNWLSAIPCPFQALTCPAGVVTKRGQRGIVNEIASWDGSARDQATAAPELLQDRGPVDGEGQRLADRGIVQWRGPDVDREYVEAGVEHAGDTSGRVG